MKYPVYHHIPSDLQGGHLYPLTALKVLYPDLYNKYVEKYEDRTQIMELKIPLLNCLWNDVVHLSAIHPKYIKEALKEIGIAFSGKYFVIDAAELDQSKLAVWLNSIDDRYGVLDEKYFEFFNPEHYENVYSLFPKERQILGWKKYIDENKKPPLLWSRCPHVLYKGEIPITNVPIIEV